MSAATYTHRESGGLLFLDGSHRDALREERSLHRLHHRHREENPVFRCSFALSLSRSRSSSSPRVRASVSVPTTRATGSIRNGRLVHSKQNSLEPTGRSGPRIRTVTRDVCVRPSPTKRPTSLRPGFERRRCCVRERPGEFPGAITSHTNRWRGPRPIRDTPESPDGETTTRPQ